MKKKAHFIGICGVGMSATAKLLKDSGYEITGSDEEFYPPVSDYLNSLNVSFSKGYRASNIPSDSSFIVIGKNAKLIPEENDEVNAAFKSGIPVCSFPEVLQKIIKDKHSIVVSGSYGKSTCSTLLSWCLLCANKEPGYFLGAVPINPMGTARLGESSYFVFEGDEYPASNWDDTSKFLYYHPRDVLLTSGAHDHVNVFKTHREYLAPFCALLALIPKDGLLVANTDDKSSFSLASSHQGQVALYGLNRPQGLYDSARAFWSASHVTYGTTSSFTLTRNGKPLVKLETKLLGTHNIQNILGVSALLLERNLLTPEELSEGVRTFRGVKRRLEALTPDATVPVFEGFGSSREKARAAIEAMKVHFPKRRLMILFEPHTFSWRNRDALVWYDDVFSGAHMVFVYHPATQGASTHKQLSQNEIVERVRASGIQTLAVHNPTETLDTMGAYLSENDVVLILTSGALDGLTETVPEMVREKFLSTPRTL